MKDVTKKYKSATHYVLSSLMPYTEANLKLVFLPRRFLADISKLERFKDKTLRNAYYKCVKDGLVEIDDLDGKPVITENGLKLLAPYVSKTLPSSMLMIIFDIPEVDRYKRTQLRVLLKQLEFKQIQKSVWASNKDSREYLKAEIKRLELQYSVKVFESRELL